MSTSISRTVRAIAKPAGTDNEGRRLFELRGRLITETELTEYAAELHRTEAEDAQLDAELQLANHRAKSYDPETLDVLKAIKAVPVDAESVDGVTAESAKLHLRALEILKEQGNGDDYSADEYVLAVEKAAA